MPFKAFFKDLKDGLMENKKPLAIGLIVGVVLAHFVS